MNARSQTAADSRAPGGLGCLVLVLICAGSSSALADELDRNHRAVSQTVDPLSTSYLPVDPQAIGSQDDAEIHSLLMLGEEIPPASTRTLYWSAGQSIEGVDTGAPVLIVNGRHSGPTLCLSAAIHGDELNGIEMVRRVMHDLDPDQLTGAVIGVPIVNLQGFQRNSRYLPDRRDLNRFFPGNSRGNAASRIASSFFQEIVLQCDALVDLHTGSFHRTNLPQLRADLRLPRVVELTRGFGSTVVLHSPGAQGTLRRAATDAGIPSVTLEAGEPMRLQPQEVEHGVKAIESLLDMLEIEQRPRFWNEPAPVYYESRWVRADRGGILLTKVTLGKTVKEDEVLGTITDPITNLQSEVRAPTDGRILGMAVNQVVLPGFAAFRIGIETGQVDVRTLAGEEIDQDDDSTPAGDRGGAVANRSTVTEVLLDDVLPDDEE